MSKHNQDLIFCRKQTGISIGKLCIKCESKCIICDSYVRQDTIVRICDQCKFYFLLLKVIMDQLKENV
jgi:PHD finger-like domain-containing protein 5A